MLIVVGKGSVVFHAPLALDCPVDVLLLLSVLVNLLNRFSLSLTLGGCHFFETESDNLVLLLVLNLHVTLELHSHLFNVALGGLVHVLELLEGNDFRIVLTLLQDVEEHVDRSFDSGGDELFTDHSAIVTTFFVVLVCRAIDHFILKVVDGGIAFFFFN